MIKVGAGGTQNRGTERGAEEEGGEGMRALLLPLDEPLPALLGRVHRSSRECGGDVEPAVAHLAARGEFHELDVVFRSPLGTCEVSGG